MALRITAQLLRRSGANVISNRWNLSINRFDGILPSAISVLREAMSEQPVKSPVKMNVAANTCSECMDSYYRLQFIRTNVLADAQIHS